MRLSAEMFEEIVDALRSDGHRDKDKRLEPRVGMAGEATLISIGPAGQRLVSRVRVRDVSRGGIGLYFPTKFAIDQRIIIQLQSCHDEPIWLICVAAYCRRLEADRYAVGARIRQVLRPEQVRQLETQLGNGAAGKLLEDKVSEDVARISKAILA